MNAKLDQPAPRRRVEVLGGTFSLGDYCKRENLNAIDAKYVMTNVLNLPVITGATLKAELAKYQATKRKAHREHS